jgi:S1-C subfamily serine protease
VKRLRAARAALPPHAAARLDALLYRSPTSAEEAAASAPAASALDGLFMDEANTVALFKRCAPIRAPSLATPRHTHAQHGKRIAQILNPSVLRSVFSCAARSCAPSVVHIRTSAVARFPFSQDATEIPQGAGCAAHLLHCTLAASCLACSHTRACIVIPLRRRRSGIVWDREGHIVTNFHVIKARTCTLLSSASLLRPSSDIACADTVSLWLARAHRAVAPIRALRRRRSAPR